MSTSYDWDASAFFRKLTETNRLATSAGYRYAEVSGLSGLEDYIEQVQSALAAICVSDTSPGYTELLNTPHTRRVKTVFLMKRHKLGDMAARQAAIDEMREIFRQFMSVLIQERTRLQEGLVYVDPRIQFTEIEPYFAVGAACAYFQIAIDTYTNLVYNPKEWQEI